MTRAAILDYAEGISVENVRLGRLVLNRHHPHQDYCDPSSTDLTSSEIKIKSYDSFRKDIGSTSLIAKFTEFVSAAFRYKNKSTKDISAIDVTTRSLHNSGEWFEKACADIKTREWIEKALKQGRSIYLIVGYCVLTDAQSDFTQTIDFTTSIDPQVVVPPVPGNIAEISAEASQQNTYEERLSAHFVGQTICAVQYRKLSFRWFSSKTLENAELEHGNRWIVTAAFRGDDEVDEQNILEVVLAEDGAEEEESDSGQESEESEGSDEE